MKRPQIALVAGVIGILTVSFLVYCWWTPKPKKSGSLLTSKPAENPPPEAEVENESESEEESEDEDDEDEEDDEEDSEDIKDKEVVQLEVKNAKTTPNDVEKPSVAAAKPVEVNSKEELAALKEQYDAAVRVGNKFTQGQHNEKAIEKLTEAINLAPMVPSAQKDLLTLYNNRSALYEKTGSLDSSLRDISVVLTMDPLHVKARVRRGRVYESQGRVQDSLQDFVHATIVERAKGGESNHDKKITELSKRLAIEKTAKTLKELRSSQAQKHQLPSKAYCRNFFEAYPSVYQWKNRFFGVSRDDLAELLQTAKKEYESSTEKDAAGVLLNLFQSATDLMKFDFSNDCYKKAFETLKDLPSLSVAEENRIEGQTLRSLLSFYHEITGTELHLLFQIDAASREFERAIELFPKNIDAHLKYNAVLLENGDKDKSIELYDKLLKLLQDQSVGSVDEKGDSLQSEAKEVKAAYRAWVYNHRASLWVSRDENGYYASDAFVKAIGDIDLSLKESGDVMSLPEGKGAHFIALLKSVQLRTHTKQAMEQIVTEEDYASNRNSIQSAKGLFPDHESVLLLEVEQLVLEGDAESAVKLVEKASRSKKYDEFIILNMKATIQTHLAFMEFQTGTQQAVQHAQELFEEINKLYTRALELDPESLEVKAQFAQLKSMIFGDLPSSISLLKDALSIARSRDEVQDLLTMLVGNEAQLRAIEDIQKGPGH